MRLSNGQMLLPFTRWPTRFDGRMMGAANSNGSAHWFADSGNQFYPFKARLMRVYGIPDGFDIQVLRDLCNGCDGSGRWGRWRSDGGEPCNRCTGTGTYRWRVITLDRYLFGDRLFHVPRRATVVDPPLRSLIGRADLDTTLSAVARWIEEGKPEEDGEKITTESTETRSRPIVFRRRITHEKASFLQARLACSWLMLRYERGALRPYLRAWWRDDCRSFWHSYGARKRPLQRLLWRVRDALAAARRRLRGEAEIPF